jgi:hypothetical protein
MFRPVIIRCPKTAVETAAFPSVSSNQSILSGGITHHHRTHNTWVHTREYTSDLNLLMEVQQFQQQFRSIWGWPYGSKHVEQQWHKNNFKILKTLNFEVWIRVAHEQANSMGIISLMKVNQHFGGTYCLHLQGQRLNWVNKKSTRKSIKDIGQGRNLEWTNRSKEKRTNEAPQTGSLLF